MSTERVGAAERRLATGTLAMLAVLAVVVATTAGVLVGGRGAVSALIGVGFVVGLFGASSLALAWAAPRRDRSAVGALVGGALGRLVLYAAALAGLNRLDWVHRPSLALATGAAVAITLAYELRALSRTPRLFWIDAQGGRPRVVPHATRSQLL